MSNVSRLDNHDNHDGSHGVLLSPQVRPMLAGYVRPRVLTGSVSEADDITVLMHYAQVLWKHKWIVLFSTLLGMLAGLGISLWTTPMYRAATSIEIQNVQEPFGPSVLEGADRNLGTQVQLLASQSMRNRVERKLDASPAQFPKTRDPLTPLRGLLRLSDPGKSIDWSRSVAMAANTRRVTPNRDSRILIIESQSPNPQAAADFTNTLAQEYMARTQEQRWESYQSTGEWLTRAQEELKNNVEESERRLQDFAKANGLMIMTGSQNISEEKLKQLQTELARASVDRIAKQSVYESSLSSPTESLPEVLDSGPMAQYQIQIADLRRQLAELSTTLTPDHYKMQRVQAQIKEVETARERERKNIISRIRIEYEAAQKRETQIERDFNTQAQVLSGQGAELIQYNILLREVETNKKLYDQTLAQGKEAGLASAMRSSNARVVDTAKVPEVPQSPNLPLNLGLGLMGGLLCGMITVVVRSTVDARIQAPGTLGAHLNLRELGVIPSAGLFPELRNRTRLLPGVIGRKSKAKTESTSILLPRDETKQPRESLELVAWTQKTAVISEAFRSVMTSILFSAENGGQPRVLVITSPSPQEGKTTVVSNLAIALAEINHRVLLIDADMRLPRLHSIFDLPNTFGLSDFLHERRPVEEYVDEELVRRTHISNLYVMPAGPARSNLSRLLYSVRMEELLSRFRGTFDTILIDSAPVLSVPDARILARVTDAVVLVVRAHRTGQESAFAAVRCFEEDGRRVLGTILNDWNPKLSPYAPYGQYGAYRSNSAANRAYEEGNYTPHIEGGGRP